MTPRTGRPLKDDPKRNQYRIRFSDDEVVKLEFCTRETGRTKAEIIREGIDKVYQELLRQK